MDLYQPIYDAARSRIPGFDSQALYEIIARQFDISRVVEMVRRDLLNIVHEHTRPSVLFRPFLSRDGKQWRAVYGGLAGFGGTPAEAMSDFDKNWDNKQKEKP